MKLVLDVENTVIEREGKLHLDPFEPDNSLIMVGTLSEDGEEHLFNPLTISKLQQSVRQSNYETYECSWR